MWVEELQKEKSIKTMSNYIAYITISKAVFDHHIATYRRRGWEPQNSAGESHI